MDVSDPTLTVTATLDGPVLAVLAAAGRPLTVGQVAALAARGSEIGVRRSLARLVEQGIVRATLMGRNHVHELNRDHIAAPIAVLLAGLRTELWRRLRTEVSSWDVPPTVASVFGSAARGDGDEASDIDILVVHPPFRGEPRPSKADQNWLVNLLGTAETISRLRLDPGVADRWEDQLDRLREAVEGWTGNRLQVVDLPFHDWRRPAEGHRALLAEVSRDGLDLLDHVRSRARARGA